MQQRVCLLILSSLLSSCSLFGFSNKEPQIIVKTVPVNIPTVSRPAPISLYDVEFYVVTEDNLEEFVARFQHDNASPVFYAISVRSYENMSLNLAELKRYIEQQKEIIIYYETQLKQKSDENK